MEAAGTRESTARDGTTRTPRPGKGDSSSRLYGVTMIFPFMPPCPLPQ